MLVFNQLSRSGHDTQSIHDGPQDRSRRNGVALPPWHQGQPLHRNSRCHLDQRDQHAHGPNGVGHR